MTKLNRRQFLRGCCVAGMAALLPVSVIADAVAKQEINFRSNPADVLNKWSSGAADPIVLEDIQAMRDHCRQQTGFKPNIIYMSESTFQILIKTGGV